MENNISNRLREAMNDMDINAAELVRRSGVSKNSISQYLHGKNVPNTKSASLLGNALRVEPLWLMGFDVPKTGIAKQTADDAPAAPSVPDAIPLTKKKIPLLGRVACGVPIYSEEEHEVWLPVDIELDAAFAVLAVGDSMIGAGIHGGDHVFIRPQPTVDNGTIALVAIGDEYTLKRVYYYPDKHKLVLNPENPAYEPLIYSDRELEDVRIIGKFIGFLRLEE